MTLHAPGLKSPMLLPRKVRNLRGPRHKEVIGDERESRVMISPRIDGSFQSVPHSMKTAITLGIFMLLSSTLAAAQDEGSGLSVRLNNRTCADLSVRPIEGDGCSELFETCDEVIAINERSELRLKTATFPMSITLQIEGRCAPQDRAIVTGSCQANLFSQAQRSINDPSAGRLDDVVRGVCNDMDVNCPGIEEFREPSRFRHRTVDIELGLCDAGPDGIDVCLPECTVP